MSKKRSPCESLPAYIVWRNMKVRCDNPNYYQYHRYGGRRISYPKKWETYQGFINDMGDSYQKGLTLDRVNNDKNYSKKNCKWSTQKQQQNNRSDNYKVTINNITKNLCEWIELSGVKSSTVHQRIFTYGWDANRALLTPARSYNVK